MGFQWPRVYGFDFSGVVVEAGEAAGAAAGGFDARPPAHQTCRNMEAFHDNKRAKVELFFGVESRLRRFFALTASGAFLVLCRAQAGAAVFGMIQGLPQRDRGTLAEYTVWPHQCRICRNIYPSICREKTNREVRPEVNGRMCFDTL